MIRNPFAQKSLEFHQQVLSDVFDQINELTTVTTSDYTTEKSVGWSYVHADATGTGTQTITLHSGAFDGQKATVKKGGNKTVTTATEGSETIDGASTDTVTTYQTYRWSDAKDEWSKV